MLTVLFCLPGFKICKGRYVSNVITCFNDLRVFELHIKKLNPFYTKFALTLQ